MSHLFEPIKTADITWDAGLPYLNGSNGKPFSPEIYLQESEHVFINGNELIKRWQLLPNDSPSQFVIAETGFGCGLNFLLACSLWQKYAPPLATLHYISSEKNPLNPEDLSRYLDLWPTLQEPAHALLASYPVLTPGFHFLKFDAHRVNLTLLLGDALACYQQLLVCGDVVIESQLREYYVDAWFINDDLTAKYPPKLLNSFFATLGILSRKKTTLTVFDNQEGIDLNLQSAGFRTNKKMGYLPAQCMLAAEFVQSPTVRRPRETPWHVSSPRPTRSKHAIVIGAGLAGCYTAHALARRGWSVSLIDKHHQPGNGASGNQQAVLYPQLSSYRSPLTEFMLSAYLFALRTYRQFIDIDNAALGELSGVLQLAYNQKEQASLQKLQAWLLNYPELGRLVNKHQASCLAGISLQAGGLFLPHTGWIDSRALCQFLVENPLIHWQPNVYASELAYHDGLWHVDSHVAEVCVLANAYNAAQFEQTNHLPLNAVRGQMTSISSNEQSSKLKLPLCAEGHILPERDGLHTIGATYHPGSIDTHAYAVDDACNLAKLEQLSSESIWSQDVMSSWTGVRAATPDYLPLLGPVASPEHFNRQYQGLASDSRRWVALPGANYPGLYVCAGFGSRGLTSIPLSAEWLAATINKEPGFIPHHLVQAFSPARFLRREIIQNKTRLAI